MRKATLEKLKGIIHNLHEIGKELDDTISIEYENDLRRNNTPPFLQKLRKANDERNQKDWKHNDWSPDKWAFCAAGEMGELLNILKKKFYRYEDVRDQDIKHEIADIIIYLDLLCISLGYWDLQKIIEDKFNKVSERIGSKVRL